MTISPIEVHMYLISNFITVGVNYNSGNTSANQSPGPVMQQQNSPLNTSGGLSAVEEER